MALTDYIASKGYLDFGSKVLDATLGFWVNLPTSMAATTTTTPPPLTTTTTSITTTSTTTTASTTSSTTSLLTTTTSLTPTTSTTTASTTTTTIINAGPPCPSVYDGTYIGQFAYDAQTYESFVPKITTTLPAGALNVTVTLQCSGWEIWGNTISLEITHANVSHPKFDCQVSGCTPGPRAIAILPVNIPTGPFQQLPLGIYIYIDFPNGTYLSTLSTVFVSSDGRTISNSLDPWFAGNTWNGLNWATETQGEPLGYSDGLNRTGWVLNKSAF